MLNTLKSQAQNSLLASSNFYSSVFFLPFASFSTDIIVLKPSRVHWALALLFSPLSTTSLHCLSYLQSPDTEHLQVCNLSRHSFCASLDERNHMCLKFETTKTWPVEKPIRSSSSLSSTFSYMVPTSSNMWRIIFNVLILHTTLRNIVATCKTNFKSMQLPQVHYLYFNASHDAFLTAFQLLLLIS